MICKKSGNVFYLEGHTQRIILKSDANVTPHENSFKSNQNSSNLLSK